MKFPIFKTLLFSTALFTTSACGTVVKLVDPTEPYSPYAGTKYDFEMAKLRYCLMRGRKANNC